MGKRHIYIALLTLIAMLMPTNAGAQFKLGLRVGTNINKAYFDKRLFSSDNRIGFLIGPTLDVKVPVLGLGLDLSIMYSYKNMLLHASQDSGLQSETKHVSTFDVPINLKWTIGNDKMFSVYGATGPQISWNIGRKSYDGIFDTKQYTMNSSLFSWNLGAGFTFLKKIRLSYNYNIGIGKTAEIEYIDKLDKDVQKDRIRNCSHQLYLTYFF